MIGHNQVALCAFLLVNRESLALKTYFGTALRAWLYFQFHLSVQSIYQLFATQQSRIEVGIDIDIQVVAQPLEHRIIRNDKRDVEIARRTSVHARSSIAFQLDDLAISHTGRNGDAHLLVAHTEHLFMSLRSLTKCQVQFGLIVLAAKTSLSTPPTPSAMAEEFLEEVGKSACIAARKFLSVGRIPVGAVTVRVETLRSGAETSEVPCLLTGLLLCLELVGMLPVFAILVVLLTLLRIALAVGSLGFRSGWNLRASLR